MHQVRDAFSPILAGRPLPSFRDAQVMKERDFLAEYSDTSEIYLNAIKNVQIEESRIHDTVSHGTGQ